MTVLQSWCVIGLAGIAFIIGGFGLRILIEKIIDWAKRTLRLR